MTIYQQAQNKLKAILWHDCILIVIYVGVFKRHCKVRWVTPIWYSFLFEEYSNESELPLFQKFKNVISTTPRSIHCIISLCAHAALFQWQFNTIQCFNAVCKPIINNFLKQHLAYLQNSNMSIKSQEIK